MAIRSHSQRTKSNNSMAKNKDRRKDRKETEYLSGIIREQDKQIKQLTRQVKFLQKRHNNELRSPKEDVEEVIVQEEPKIPCTDCGKGHYHNFLEILDRLYATCDTCSTPKRLK